VFLLLLLFRKSWSHDSSLELQQVTDPSVTLTFAAAAAAAARFIVDVVVLYYVVRAVGSRPSFNALCFLLHCAKSVLV
jgi:hypothetical protein